MSNTSAHGRSSEQELEVSNLLVSKTPKKTRYSDAELLEFKELILGKIEKYKKDLDLLKSSKLNENGTDDTSPKIIRIGDGEGDGAPSLGVERDIARIIQIIQYLQVALVRIETKTYGICRQTGKLISKERLRAVPHATLSIEAKNLQK